MAKNVSLLGANYPDVPAVQLPQTGGGTATFYDIQVVDNLNSSSAVDALSAKQGKVLNDKLTKQSFEIAENEITDKHSSISSISAIPVNVWGNIVIMNISLTLSSDIPAWSSLFTVPLSSKGATPAYTQMFGQIYTTSGIFTSREIIKAGKHNFPFVYIKV